MVSVAVWVADQGGGGPGRRAGGRDRDGPPAACADMLRPVGAVGSGSQAGIG